MRVNSSNPCPASPNKREGKESVKTSSKATDAELEEYQACIFDEIEKAKKLRAGKILNLDQEGKRCALHFSNGIGELKLIT